MSLSKPKPYKKPKPRAKQESSIPELDESWSMYPALHGSVSRLLKDDGLSLSFFEIDEDHGIIEEYDTNIMGRFKCLNKACRKPGWGSRTIAITIRMYTEQRYNARVYHQRCKGCRSVSQPFPNKSYAERLAYRLKKWNGIEIERPIYNDRTSDRPHQSALCEGCKHGHCRLAWRTFHD